MDTRAAAFDKYATMRDLWYINRLIQIDNLDRIPEPSPDAGKATMK
jgi:ABC-type transporter lipoprotein component MlaA